MPYYRIFLKVSLKKDALENEIFNKFVFSDYLFLTWSYKILYNYIWPNILIIDLEANILTFIVHIIINTWSSE